MKNKIFIIAPIFLLVVGIISLAVYHNSLVEIKDEQSALNAISKTQNINTLTDIKIVDKEKYLGIFGQYNEDKVGIFIFEKDPVFRNRYKYFGKTITKKGIGDFEYKGNDNNKSQYILAVDICTENDKKYSDLNIEIFTTDIDTGEKTVLQQNKVSSFPYCNLFYIELDYENDFYFDYVIYDDNQNIVI